MSLKSTEKEQRAPTSNPQSNQRFSLTRVHTGQYLDSASVYHPEEEREKIAGAGSQGDEGVAESSSEEAENVEEVPEIRDVILNERDVEIGGVALEKKKTSKSVKSAQSARDPNEV